MGKQKSPLRELTESRKRHVSAEPSDFLHLYKNMTWSGNQRTGIPPGGNAQTLKSEIVEKLDKKYNRTKAQKAN